MRDLVCCSTAIATIFNQLTNTTSSFLWVEIPNSIKAGCSSGLATSSSSLRRVCFDLSVMLFVLSVLGSILQSGDARRQKTLHEESGARPLIGYPSPK